jgi:hypothetical protein
MKTHELTGMDDLDIQTKLREWRAANPNAVVVTQHPIQRLPLSMKPVVWGNKVEARRLVSLCFDYTD